ncbi:MAG: hypothetical protein HZC54_21315 [Verrucomicrobia bacterium]|nr:hypothetical protein [Verrucomicrobiota bacterium]
MCRVVFEMSDYTSYGLFYAASIGPFTGDFSENSTQSEMRAFRDWANSWFYATAR